jgi:REP element-mobilizing transposase RayT
MEYPGAWYHVMNRGRRRAKVFLDSSDYEAFIKVLQEAAEGWNLRISAYCLRPNHYHLLIQTPDGNLARCMRHINGVYTQRFNRRHEKDGQLFRGRYKAVLVAADSHLLEVLRYIHRNPLRAGLVDELLSFPWSSHHGYISTDREWAWLHNDFLLNMLSDKKSKRKSAYLDFVSQSEPDEIARFYSLKNLPSILGSAFFKEWVKEKFRDLSRRKEIPESRSLAPTAAKIIGVVSAHFKVKEEDLFVSRRGAENLPRDVAIYLVRRYCRETLAVIGRHFSIDNYSTVSTVIARIKARKDHDRTLRKQLERLGTKLDKSHP